MREQIEQEKQDLASAQTLNALDQYNFGECYPKDPIYSYQLAAKQGFAQTYYDLGVRHLKGDRVNKDENIAIYYFQLAANQGNKAPQVYARAQYALGICYAKGLGIEEDEKEAVRYFQSAADQGFARAQSSLGCCYVNGRGVEKDEKEAVRYYQLAAKQGDSYGLVSLGLCYQYERGVEKDISKAFEQYRAAADQDNPYGQNCLGWCYERGIGVEQDAKVAVSLYQKAAKKGFALAQSNLSRCYQKGIGVETNESEAVLWADQAARQTEVHKHIAASFACCYEQGRGVERDLSQAQVWRKYLQEKNPVSSSSLPAVAPLSSSTQHQVMDQVIPPKIARKRKADQNAPKPLHSITPEERKTHIKTIRTTQGGPLSLASQNCAPLTSALMEERAKSKPVKEQEKQDYKKYLASAQTGNALGQYNLGCCYAKGRGVEKDEKEAVRYFQLAAEQKNASAQYDLGLCYANGWGVGESKQEAAHYFQLAAKQGIAKAQNVLGLCYATGWGVEKNEQEAVHYLQLAAKQGDAQAQYNLGLYDDKGPVSSASPLAATPLSSSTQHQVTDQVIPPMPIEDEKIPCLASKEEKKAETTLLPSVATTTAPRFLTNPKSIRYNSRMQNGTILLPGKALLCFFTPKNSKQQLEPRLDIEMISPKGEYTRHIYTLTYQNAKFHSIRSILHWDDVPPSYIGEYEMTAVPMDIKNVEPIQAQLDCLKDKSSAADLLKGDGSVDWEAWCDRLLMQLSHDSSEVSTHSIGNFLC